MSGPLRAHPVGVPGWATLQDRHGPVVHVGFDADLVASMWRDPFVSTRDPPVDPSKVCLGQRRGLARQTSLSDARFR
jgi:hypothetical protein